MAIWFRIYPGGQNYYADNAYIQYACSAQDLYNTLNNASTLPSTITANNQFKPALVSNYGEFLNHGQDNSYTPSGWSMPLRPVISIKFQYRSDIDDFINVFGNDGPNKRYQIYYAPDFGGGHQNLILYQFKFDTSLSYAIQTKYLINNEDGFIEDSGVTVVNVQSLTNAGNYEFFELNAYDPSIPSQCDDERTSDSTQGVYITTNWKDILGNDLTEDYELLFQPDSQHTSGSISFTNQFQALMGLKEVTCRFNRGVVRDSGYIKINGHIDAEIYKVDMLGNTLVPVFDTVTENFIIQFMFEPCCDYPVSVSETYSDAIASLEEEGANLMMGKLVFDSIEWHGFALLQNYCCDDVDCEGVDFEGNDEPIYIGVGGGGDSVDITCICDNLELINDTLTSKFTALNGKMDSLIETIEDKDLTVELDECICNNLESISDKLDSLDDIKDSIDNKVIPVTDVSSVANAITNKQIPITDVSGITTAINNKQIPVTDVSGITTAINNKQIPVTNVSGIESAITNKQIPVTDVSGLNTTLGNIDSSLGQIDGSIAGGTASIGSSIDDLDISLGGINTSLGGIDSSIDGVGTAISNQSFSVDTTGLTCTDSQGNEEGLACILKNALNNRDNKGLADVIDDKDTSSYVDVAVEPYDMVNIRRAFKDDDIQEG